MQCILKATVVLSLTVLPAIPQAAAADSADVYPRRPVRLVIAQTPGSSIDAMARIVATRMSQFLGQQLVVDNRTGAGGTIGGAIVAHATPDGYTLFAGATASQVIGPQLYKKFVTYDPFRDFAPVSLFAMTQNVLVVNPNTPFKTVKDLLDYAKANPGKLNWSNAGTGFQSHLAGVLFTHMAKIEVLHVPYKGAGIVPAPSVMGHLSAGRLRALAMGGEKRSPLAPEIPTIIESGVPGYTSRGWAGLIAPANTPKAIQGKLLKTLHRTVNDPGTNKALQKIGAEPLTSTPEEFAALIKSDWTSFGNAIRVSGIKAN
jgi:tripartite-type tricarboxylate transporter receptor subunit TctC